VSAITDPTAINRDLHVTGPDPLSADDAVRVAERVTGRRFKVQKVPIAVLQVASRVLRPFNPVMSSLLAMGVGMEQGERTDALNRLREFGVTPTTFDHYVRGAVEAHTRSEGEEHT
jgi:uncharacterized protein YbjT (DUF2867 family)